MTNEKDSPLNLTPDNTPDSAAAPSPAPTSSETPSSTETPQQSEHHGLFGLGHKDKEEDAPEQPQEPAEKHKSRADAIREGVQKEESALVSTITRSWISTVFRGLLLVALGLFALFSPSLFSAWGSIALAAYFVIDAIGDVVQGIRLRKASAHHNWWFIKAVLVLVLAAILVALPLLGGFRHDGNYWKWIAPIAGIWAIISGVTNFAAGRPLFRNGGSWFFSSLGSIIIGVLVTAFGLFLALYDVIKNVLWLPQFLKDLNSDLVTGVAIGIVLLVVGVVLFFSGLSQRRREHDLKVKEKETEARVRAKLEREYRK